QTGPHSQLMENQSTDTVLRKETVQLRLAAVQHRTTTGELRTSRRKQIVLNFHVNDLERRNTELEDRVQSAERTLASSREEREQAEVEVRRVIEVLDPQQQLGCISTARAGFLHVALICVPLI
uniref:Uncharacterized protein n=1 Tax=Lates calcarifer TaxID=8187 RepID=A0A4W6DZQ2_LATCA